jgi:hypothetical protein
MFSRYGKISVEANCDNQQRDVVVLPALKRVCFATSRVRVWEVPQQSAVADDVLPRARSEKVLATKNTEACWIILRVEGEVVEGRSQREHRTRPEDSVINRQQTDRERVLVFCGMTLERGGFWL